MPVWVEGALVGLGIGAAMVFFEWYFLRKTMLERAEKYKKAPAFEDQEKRRIATMARFVPILTIGFAIGYWFIWG